MRLAGLVLVLIAGWHSVSVADDAPPLDKTLPKYEPQVTGVTGEFVIECSPLTKPLVTQWAKSFQTFHPQINIVVTPTAGRDISGYSQAAAFVFEGPDSFPPVLKTSRDPEGIQPVVVGLDRLDFIVHKSNPIEKLRADEVAWVLYSPGRSYESNLLNETQKEFLDHPRIDDWNRLREHLFPASPDAPIHVYRLQNINLNDTNFVDDELLGTNLRGDGLFAQRSFRPDARTVHSTSQMIQKVSTDQFSIGYVSHSLLTSKVRSVPLEGRPQEDSKPIGEKEEPQQENLKYPVMVRPIYLWVSQGIQEIDPKLEAEFVRFILSRQGQATTLSAGFFPLPSQTGQ